MLLKERAENILKIAGLKYISREFALVTEEHTDIIDVVGFSTPTGSAPCIACECGGIHREKLQRIKDDGFIIVHLPHCETGDLIIKSDEEIAAQLKRMISKEAEMQLL